jgi:P-type conjugative transfer protein TrbJ
MNLSRFRSQLLSSVSACLIAAAVAVSPASAFIVFDPSNYVQNTLTAARSLEQISNQIRSLQNEARMLIDQARNLTKLPYSALQSIEQSLSQTEDQLKQAQGLGYNIQQIQSQYGKLYSSVNVSASDKTLADDAQTRWQNSVSGFEDALKVQAGVVDDLSNTRTELDNLVSRSQGAAGALQAAQAGNQLLAVQTRQLADLTAAVTSENRANLLEAARNAAAEDQAREQFRRFVSTGQGYQPSPVQMFYGN